LRHCSGTATNRRSRILTYEIVGSNISLTLTADEINEVIEALETRDGDIAGGTGIAKTPNDE